MNANIKLTAIIVAGGMGTRLGYSIPKAFVPLNGQALFLYSYKIFDQHSQIQEIITVVPKGMVEQTTELITSNHPNKKFKVVVGGEERWGSVQNGVKASSSECDWLLIHDAARPFVTDAVIDDLVSKREAFECAITVTPVTDTIRKYEDHLCLETVDRSTLVRVGTPQLFKKDTLQEGFKEISNMDVVPTDEAMLMEKRNIPVGLSWGNPLNFKVTTKEDINMAEALIFYDKMKNEIS